MPVPVKPCDFPRVSSISRVPNSNAWLAATSRKITQNSSPPSRQIECVPSKTVRNMDAAQRSALSPAKCPLVSLTNLKSSISTNTRTSRPERLGSARTPASSCENRSRFPKSVKGSFKAMCSKRASVSLLSVISRETSKILSTGSSARFSRLPETSNQRHRFNRFRKRMTFLSVIPSATNRRRACSLCFRSSGCTKLSQLCPIRTAGSYSRISL
jgi:hypothetical protein